jgi:hypothetical protein
MGWITRDGLEILQKVTEVPLVGQVSDLPVPDSSGGEEKVQGSPVASESETGEPSPDAAFR